MTESIDFKKFLNIKFSFSNNFENIREFVSHLSPIIEKNNKEISSAFLKAIEEAYNKSGINFEELKTNAIELSDEQKKLVYRNLKLPESKVIDGDGNLWKSNFILLISSFEIIISDLISHYYKKYPESLKENSFEFKFSKLLEYNNIEDFTDEIISNKVESLLYKSFEDQKKYLNKEIKIDLHEDIINWSLIKEAYLRRNLIVHNDSKINKRYIQEYSNKSEAENLKEGEKIAINKEYFNDVYEELYSAGFILIQHCWRKWYKEFEEVANSEIIDISYESNMNNNFKISEKITRYGRQLHSTNNDFKFRNNVNHCLALKKQNKSKEYNEIIKSIDISNLSPIFVLAFHCLNNDCSKALEQIKNAKVVDKLTYDDIMNWPLFEELRNDEKFIKKVNSIYRRTVK